MSANRTGTSAKQALGASPNFNQPIYPQSSSSDCQTFFGQSQFFLAQIVEICQRKSKKDPPFAEHYHVFNHGNIFFQKKAFKPSINWAFRLLLVFNHGHFIGNKRATRQALIQKNIERGIDGFQIDAAYEHLLFAPQQTGFLQQHISSYFSSSKF